MSGYDLSRLSKLGKIGEGTYGLVYKCLDRKSGLLKALKQVKLEHYDQGVPSTTLREIALLRELKHPNIVILEHVVLDDGQLYLVFEYLNVDLRRYLDLNYKNTGLPAETVKSFMYQMLQALCYCHIRRVIHRDLKPQNVLVDVSRSVVKLADFGLARSIGYPLRTLTHEIATLWYRSPEILLGEAVYCCGVDMWSMGCVFAEMATGDPLFCGDSEIDQLLQIFRVMGIPTEASWPGVTRLPHYKPKLFPSWHADRLCSQEKV
ncbi:Cyclin-dependent kinase 1, partial [Taenia solium]